ncbi:biorientation of chromosomes in cell division protein 1-like 1 isoform X2 [Zootermopsis nevadensis]|uniref:biorientation of chromosomes in cell division protein 1-like 1 isoform X2 n=1 Tax=Zootermopsis nevadensis TaxID=136037 RepID=UPI000B8E4F6D|nr:biorientation of chromosomes in cell division protein 1-like 1 isoform X2 [Zootermopsis nevadensis]
MEVGMMQYPPGDSRMIDKIVHQLKSQGIFDQFRKECLADVDTKPAYQNLHQRVEGSVSGFLASQVWRPDLNKNQLRDSLRKYIHESGFLDIGVERIVDQVVNPKILTVFMPQVEDVVYKYLGIEKPKKGKENQTVYVASLTAENIAQKEEKKLPTLTDLLPKELEPISPESDTLKEKDDSDEDEEVGFPDGREEEDSSPPFEPIEKVNSHLEESSVDSHLSGISELTSHESQHSHVSFMISNHANNNSSIKMPASDLSNHDSQLSKVSSGSRLSIVSFYDQDCRLTYNTEINDDSEQSKTSLPVSGQDTRMSMSIGFTDDENEMKDMDVQVTGDISYEESSIYANKLQISAQNSSHSISDGIITNENLRPETDQEESSQDERSQTKIDYVFEMMCEDTPEEKIVEEYEPENYISEYEYNENEDNIMVDEFESKRDVGNQMMINEEFEEMCEEEIDEKSDELIEEKSEEMTDEKLDKKTEVQVEFKFEEMSVKKESEKSEIIAEEKQERKVEEKYEMRQDEDLEKELDDKSERRLEERLENKLEEKSERKLDDKFDRKLYEKSTRKLDEKPERKTNDKLERKLDEKSERKLDDKSDEKSERKYVEGLEHKLDERDERKSDEISEKKSDEKLIRKLDERSVRKTDEKSEKKLVDKSEKKLDIKLEKKTDDKSERKSDLRCEKKVDDKHDKKQDKHREDRDKSREKKDEKKRLNSDSKDVKKNDPCGHLPDVDRKRSDKDKHKRDRGDSRSKAQKSSKDGKEKTEKDGIKEKVQHEEKADRDIVKEKFKQGIRETKDEKRSDEREKKIEKDSSKEKSKKEDCDVLRHEKDTKKSKSDEKREQDGKEKPKAEEKVQMKHDDRHKERTKCESRDKSDKDKATRHDDKNSKDGSRSSSKESKDRIKQETKDKGKDTTNKTEEKKSKKKSKHEKSGKAAAKGSEKTDKKKEETETGKSSRSDRKSKNGGKKGKENKGKSITDDHRIHRDKRSDDRRSTDRDSNGTAQNRSVGSTTSRTNGNDSQRSQSRRDKSGSSSNSSKSDGGNSESSTVGSSKNVEDNIPSTSKSSSPPSSLPFKKRPLSIQSEDENDSVNGGSREFYCIKIKKPKIAANIFEVKKIMMLRKSLAKKERRQQRELKRIECANEKVKEVRSEKKMTKPVVAKRRKLGDIEKSLRRDVDASLSKKQMPQVESDKEDGPAGLKYFGSELNPSHLSRSDSDFLAYVKRLVESDNLSEISTSSDPESEMSDMDDIIQLPSSYLDDIVAAELGAKICKTNKGTEIVLNLPEDKEMSKKALPGLHSTKNDSIVVNKGSTAIDHFLIISSPGQDTGLTNPRKSIMRHNVEERSNLKRILVRSSSSDTSADDVILNDRNVKRILKRQHLSSVAGTNSNKSTSEKIDVASNGLDAGKIPDSSSDIQKKRVLSRKRVKKEIAFMPEMKPPEVAVEKRDLRKSRKPSTRYSKKIFTSCLADEDMNHDAFLEERDSVKLDDDSSVVTCNDVSRNVPSRANSTSPISVGGNNIIFTMVKIPATVTQADDDSSDRENVSEPLAEDRYDIIKDNNNIDKGSSEDERGCTDGSMLNQDLILPTLRDLMVESGFRTEDDKSDILPSLAGIGKSVGNSLPMTGSNVHNVALTVRGAHETSEGTQTKRPVLNRSRRVGLGRPHPKRSSEQEGEDDTGNRMPPSSNTADFVMPLSPESDVSASSGEAKKSVVDSKVGDSHTAPSPSNSVEKAGHMSNSRLGDTEMRKSLRSGGIGTPGSRAQRYSSDDLYKPRPLFSQGSRRVRGLVSPSLSQDVTNCASKCHVSDVTKTLPPSSKTRR